MTEAHRIAAKTQKSVQYKNTVMNLGRLAQQHLCIAVTFCCHGSLAAAVKQGKHLGFTAKPQRSRILSEPYAPLEVDGALEGGAMLRLQE